MMNLFTVSSPSDIVTLTLSLPLKLVAGVYTKLLLLFDKSVVELLPVGNVIPVIMSSSPSMSVIFNSLKFVTTNVSSLRDIVFSPVVVGPSFVGLTMYVMVDVVEPPFPSDIVTVTLSLPLKLVAGVYKTFPVPVIKVTSPWKPAFRDTEVMLRVSFSTSCGGDGVKWSILVITEP